MAEILEKSEFNMSFSLFYRLDNLFNALNRASLSLDLYLWYNLILVLYKEIAPLIKKDERDNYKIEMDKLIPEFIRIRGEIEDKGNYNISAGLYQKLQTLEIALRDVVNARGIYLRIKDDISFGFR